MGSSSSSELFVIRQPARFYGDKPSADTIGFDLFEVKMAAFCGAVIFSHRQLYIRLVSEAPTCPRTGAYPRRLSAYGIRGTSSTLFSFPMTGGREGRQGFGETGVLIG